MITSVLFEAGRGEDAVYRIPALLSLPSGEAVAANVLTVSQNKLSAVTSVRPFCTRSLSTACSMEDSRPRAYTASPRRRRISASTGSSKASPSSSCAVRTVMRACTSPAPQ